jgi:hypothetical protein
MAYPQQPNFRSGEPKAAWWYSRDVNGGVQICSTTYTRMVARLQALFGGTHWQWMAPSGEHVVGARAMQEPYIANFDYNVLAQRPDRTSQFAAGLLSLMDMRAENRPYLVLTTRNPPPGATSQAIEVVLYQPGRGLGTTRAMLLPPLPADAAALQAAQANLQAAHALEIQALQGIETRLIADQALARSLIQDVAVGARTTEGVTLAALTRIPTEELVAYTRGLSSAPAEFRSFVQAWERSDAAWSALAQVEARAVANASAAIDTGIAAAYASALSRAARYRSFARFAGTFLPPSSPIHGGFSNQDIMISGRWDWRFQSAIAAMFRAYYGGPIFNVPFGITAEAILDGTSPFRYAMGRWLAGLPAPLRSVYEQLQGDYTSHQISPTSLTVACWLYTSFNPIINAAVEAPGTTTVPSWMPDVTQIRIRQDAVLPIYDQLVFETMTARSFPSLECQTLAIPTSQVPRGNLIPRPEIIRLGLLEGGEAENAGIREDVSQALQSFTQPEIRSRLPLLLLTMGVAGGATWWLTSRRKKKS